MNSQLKQSWVEAARDGELAAEFEVNQELIDRMLMFINPPEFKRYVKVRENPELAKPMTPEQFYKAAGRVPEAKIEMPGKPSAA